MDPLLTVQPSVSHAVRVQFDALLIKPLLQPLERAMGDAASLGTAAFAREIAAQMESLR